MIGIAASSGFCLDPPGRLVAVEHGQLDVHEDQIRPLGLGEAHAGLASVGPRSARSRRWSADRG